MQSTVSLINPVFGGSQMMFGTNVQSVRYAADVNQVSFWRSVYMSTMCYIFHTHFSIVNCLVEESQRGGIWFLVPFPRGRREEPHPIPDHAVPQARPAQLQCSCRQQVHGEREKSCADPLIQPVAAAHIYVCLISVRLYSLVMTSLFCLW